MFWIRLNDLDAQVGDGFLPIFAPRPWVEVLQRHKLLRSCLQHLADQIFTELPIVAIQRQHWQKIAGLHCPEEIQAGATLDKLTRESCIRSKEQGALVLDNSRIEMRLGHRRRTLGGLTIDLG